MSFRSLKHSFRKVSLVVLLSLVGLGLYWWTLPVEITFIVPAGYRGPVALVFDEEADEWAHFTRKHEVTIPQNGVVLVESLGPLGTWHQERAQYDDGTILRVGPELPPGAVALRSLGVRSSDQRTVVWFVVGTLKDEQHFRQHGDERDSWLEKRLR